MSAKSPEQRHAHSQLHAQNNPVEAKNLDRVIFFALF